MQRCGAWGAFVLQMLMNKLHHSHILLRRSDSNLPERPKQKKHLHFSNEGAFN
jgi:hypothetical protein